MVYNHSLLVTNLDLFLEHKLIRYCQIAMTRNRSLKTDAKTLTIL